MKLICVNFSENGFDLQLYQIYVNKNLKLILKILTY
jgi:hypothetical protein